MKPIRPKKLPCEIRVESGILKQSGALLSPPDKSARRFLFLCDLPDTDPAPSILLKSLQKAGQTVTREADEANGFDAILAAGDTKPLENALRYATDRFPGIPLALVPTTFPAQLGFPLSDGVGLVLCDPSLPVNEAETRLGVAELIRYGVGFDRLLLDLLYTDFDRAPLIRRCLTIRCDLFDAGKTDLLDLLGAPLGQAVETALAKRDPANDFDPADALSVGLAMATRYALKSGFCRRDFLSALVGLLSFHGLPNSALLPDEEVIASLRVNAQTVEKTVLSLPRRPGECGLLDINPDSLTGLLPA